MQNLLLYELKKYQKTCLNPSGFAFCHQLLHCMLLSGLKHAVKQQMAANSVGDGFIHLTKTAYMRKLNKNRKNGDVPFA